MLQPPSTARALAALLCAGSIHAAQCPLDKLTAGDAGFQSLYGSAVDVSGDRAVVGAFNHTQSLFGDGAAYVYERSGASWVEVAQLAPLDAAAGDNFGCAVAIDGDTLAVSAPFDDDLATSSGAVYVFERVAGVWTETAKLVPSFGSSGNRLGEAVALSGDLLVASVADDPLGFPFGVMQPGGAFVFERSGGVWTETAFLQASDGFPGQQFGFSVAADGAAGRVFVGAPGDEPQSIFQIPDGAVYVYELEDGAWAESAKLTAADSVYLGAACAADGDRLLLGASDAAGGPGATGSAHVFERAGGVWNEVQKLEPQAGEGFANYGGDVALEGGVAAVAHGGGGLIGSDRPGSVVLYALQGGSWTETAELEAPDAAPLDGFSRSLGLSGDLLVLGAPADDDHALSSGSAYLYSVSESGCPALFGAPEFLSVTSGTEQVQLLDAGPSQAGRPYLLLGSASGTVPGISVDTVLLPLNFDVYTVYTLQIAASPLYPGSFGLLDGDGQGSAAKVVEDGINPALAGLVVSYAYLTFGPLGTAQLASNAIGLTLLP